MIPWTILGLSVPLALAAAQSHPPPGLPRRLADAETQYQYARDLHRAGSAATSIERWLAMERALRAYRAVECYWPNQADVAAEAAFRRGEIERVLERPGPALAAFESVLHCGADPDWGARARLAIADLRLDRRELRAARERLLQVVADLEVSPRWRNRARERNAEVLLALGWADEAYAAAAAWLPEASSTVEQVRAVDLQVRARLAMGRRAEAAELLFALDRRTAGLAAYAGEEAAALRRALAQMQGRAALSSD